MSGAYGKTARSRSRSSSDDYIKRSLLAKVNKSELKLLRVAVRRNDVIAGGPHLPLERSIDDPARICAYVHYRKDESQRLQPPIFGRGIKVNQDFTEKRRVFTHEKDSKSSRKSRSRSRYRSRSPRNQARSRGRTESQERDRRKRSRRSSSLRRSRSRNRSKSDRNRSSTKRDSSRRSSSKHRSRSKERRYSSERRKYKEDPPQYSSQRSRRSRSRSLLEHEPSCPMYNEREHKKKSLTPLRPGEYRPGHPDLALRNKKQRSRSRSRSRDKSRSPKKSDRYKRRSRSPYSNRSPPKRSYKKDRSRSSRSPQYVEPAHGDYGYYEGWGPGPRLPVGRGGYPMQPYYAPAFTPRGMIPGPFIPPGHMIVPRIPMIPPYGPYRPHLPVYNSGAVRQRGPRPNVKPSTVTSEKDKDGDNNDNRVVITEMNEKDYENIQLENTGNLVDKNGDQNRLNVEEEN